MKLYGNQNLIRLFWVRIDLKKISQLTNFIYFIFLKKKFEGKFVTQNNFEVYPLTSVANRAERGAHKVKSILYRKVFTNTSFSVRKTLPISTQAREICSIGGPPPPENPSEQCKTIIFSLRRDEAFCLPHNSLRFGFSFLLSRNLNFSIFIWSIVSVPSASLFAFPPFFVFVLPLMISPFLNSRSSHPAPSIYNICSCEHKYLLLLLANANSDINSLCPHSLTHTQWHPLKALSFLSKKLF